MEIQTTAVVGAGAMGTGIATALALAGYSVLLKDMNVTLAEASKTRMGKTLESRVRKGKMSEGEAKEVLDRITVVDDWGEFAGTDLVIEAAAETIEVKQAIFQTLDVIVPEHTIFATNTSSLSITWIGSVTSRPDRVIGMHFFNPAHVMKLVEVVCGLDTSERTVAQVGNVCRRMEKLAVQVQECASFLVNRLLGRYGGEALYMLADQIVTPTELDEAAVVFAMPMGPVTLRDFTGIDIGYQVAQFNYREYGPRFEPCPLLQHLFDRGWLGQKTRRGFYDYELTTLEKRGVNPHLDELLKQFPSRSERFDIRRLFLPMINEAFLILQERIVLPEALDPALCAGLGMRKGPLQLAEEIGLAECLYLLEKHFEQFGERFRPAPLLRRLVWGKRLSIFRRA